MGGDGAEVLKALKGRIGGGLRVDGGWCWLYTHGSQLIGGYRLVSTATATAPLDTANPVLGGKAHFYLRRLHSLTGLVFGGYLIVHLLVNATLLEGARHDGDKTVFQMQVDKIHSLPFLGFISASMIFLPLTFHTLYGIYVTINGKGNVGHYGYGKNWAYTLQRWSAITIFAFAIFHVCSLKFGLFGATLSFDPELATESTLRHLGAHWAIAWVVYPIGILASTFHLANGFWTGAITWGLTVSKQAQQRFGYVCVGIFLFSTACGFSALASTLTHKSGDAVLPGKASVEMPASMSPERAERAVPAVEAAK